MYNILVQISKINIKNILKFNTIEKKYISNYYRNCKFFLYFVCPEIIVVQNVKHQA